MRVRDRQTDGETRQEVSDWLLIVALPRQFIRSDGALSDSCPRGGKETPSPLSTTASRPLG